MLMKEKKYYAKKGYIQPVPVYVDHLVWFVLIMGFLILFCHIFLSDFSSEENLSLIINLGIFLTIFYILDCCSFVKVNTSQKTIKVWGLVYQIIPKTINLSNVAALHIRYSYRDVFNIVLTLQDGSHQRLSIRNANAFAEQIKAIAPGIEIYKE